MAAHLIVDLLLGKAQSRRHHSRRDDGMVVGDLAVVEHLLALGQLLARQRRGVFGVVGQFRQDARALRIDIVAQIGGIHTRIGGVFLLVEALDGLQGLVGRHVVFLVAFHLQRGQVVEPRRGFGAFLGGNIGHSKLFPFNALQVFLAVFHGAILALSGRECRIPINGRQHPIGLWLEVHDFVVTVDNQGQSWGLHPANGQHLAVLAIFQGIESCGVHAQQPVTNGTRESSLIKRLIISLVFQCLEALTDGLLGQGRNPKALHRTLYSGLLHHPALDELSFLPSIAAVHDFVGLLKQRLNDLKLLLHTFVGDQLDTETRRYHRQAAQGPCLPLVGVVVRLLQGAKMAESPRHLIAVTFHVSFMGSIGSQHFGDVAGDTWFFGDTDYHFSWQLFSCRAVTLWQPYILLFIVDTPWQPYILFSLEFCFQVGGLHLHQELGFLFLGHKPHQIGGLEGDACRRVQDEMSLSFDGNHHGVIFIGQA